MPFLVTPLYAGLFGLLAVALGYRVTTFRRRFRAAFGDAGDKRFNRAVRGHANFAGRVPFGLVLLLVIELLRAPPILLHAVGLMLLVGRLLHAWGVSQEPETIAFRSAGTILTASAVGTASLTALAIALGWRI